MASTRRIGSLLFDWSDPHPLNACSIRHVQDLVTEPVQPWDALICSSSAGRDAVEQVLKSREEQLQWRTGASADRLRRQRPKLPVIPLPLPS